jgi:hypothetical protein
VAASSYSCGRGKRYAPGVLVPTGLGSNKSTERVPSAAVSLARARLLGVQVFFCPVGVIVMQQFTVILF